MLLYRYIIFVVLLHYSLLHGPTGSETTLCPTVYTVDVTATSQLIDSNYSNITSSTLQDLLKNISNAPSDKVTRDSRCTEIRILRGHHVITSNFTFIGHNLILVGEIEDGHHITTISFNLSDVFDPRLTYSPQYVFSFINSSLIELRDLSFLESPGIITAINVKSVLIENCSFRYFFQGAVDLYNCHFVTIQDSIFEHNGPAAIVKKERYRGHSGGISFGYVRLKVEDGPRVSVSNCTFRNNTSDPRSVAVQRTSDLLQRFVFTGRGGGCTFIVSPYTPLTAEVENSIFEDNFARSFAGALYLGLNGSLDHRVTVNRVQFIRNVCAGGGGAIFHFGFADGRGESVNQLYISNSEFTENYAMFGGGVYYIVAADARGTLSNSALFYNCTFTRNGAKEFGSAFGAANIRDTMNIYFENCVFERNDGGRGGVLSTAYTTFTFRGNSSFIQNRGRALVVIGAYIEVRGAISFVENNGAGIDGGAVYVTSLGQLKLFRGANITFTGNSGVIGAGIVIDALPVPSVYSSLVKNPLCTLLYEDSSQRPDNWDNVTLSFSENTAIIASGVHLNNLDLCSWTGKQSPWFEPHNVFRWKFVEYSESNMNSAHDPDGYNQDWSVQTSAVDIKITSNVTVAYPGEHIQLRIQALDEIRRPTSDIIRITDLSDNAMYRFEPSTITINNITQGAVHTSYLSPTKDIVHMSSRTLQVETLLGSTTFANAELQSRKCLPGYVLSDSHGGSYKTCYCDISNPHILECNGADILLNAGLWATTNSYSTHDTVVMYPCPTGYCRCVPITKSDSIHCQYVYRSTDPDSQCSCERKGDLCGECKDGKGVSALLNRCTDCSDVSGLLIPLLLVLNAIVFTVLLVIMKPLPTWVYPCVFYIQIVPYLTEHFPTTFDRIQPALYYISSGLSFYFIYDFCLYSNMSPAVSYLLRYLPLLLATVIVGCWFAVMSKFRRKPQNWNGLWWIVMLMYTHLVHTSVSILNCPVLPGRDSSHKPKWYVSGNIQCFSSDHAGLGLLAIIILTLCMVMIPLSLAYNMEWIKHPRLLKHVFEPLILPFKQRYRWWASVDLSRRVLLIVFVISFPQNEYSVTIVLMIILTLYGFIQPYREKAINSLEVMFSVNVIILFLLRNTQTVEDTYGIPSIPHTDNNSTSQCTDNQSIKITAFTWILFPLYYSSLFITCIVATVWITLDLRYKMKARQHQQRTFSVMDSSLLRKQVSTTEIVMNVHGNATGRSLAYSDCDNNFADIVINK